MTPTAAGLARLAGPTDADLLARFAAARDDAAFAELVRRHGPAVLAVCRRLTGHAHDAEDAFQAAFLVLARKADRVRPGEPVAAWLYGVAVRAARNAAARAWRRRETLVEAVPDVPARPAEPFDPDAAAAVLDEVGRLPAFLRAAVILCELEGRPRAAAARELGVAEGTLSSRLAAARKRLAARLAARGFAPAVLAALAPAAVPPALAASTSALASDAPRAGVAVLTRGVDRAMIPHQLLAVPVILGVVAVAALAAGTAAPADVPRPAVVPLRAAAQPTAPKAAKKAAPLNRLMVWYKDELVALDPDGENRKVVLAANRLPEFVSGLAVSPDGKRVAVTLQPNAALGTFVYDLAKGRPTDEEALCGNCWLAWSGDGSEVAVCTNVTTPLTESKATCFLYNPATAARTPVKWPVGHRLSDWSPDGRTFLTTFFPKERPVDVPYQVWMVDRDGTPRGRFATDVKFASGGRFSPDGEKVLLHTIDTRWPYAGKKEGEPPAAVTGENEYGLTVVDVVTGRATTVKGVLPSWDTYYCCWSPDGSRIAYVQGEQHPEGTPRMTPTTSRLTVCDPDGGNPVVVLTDKTQFTNERSIRGVDWR